MYTYQEFKTAIMNHFQDKMGKEVKVAINQVIKNNNLIYDALIILSKDEVITPSIYLNSFYDSYVNGEDLCVICEQIYNLYQTNRFPVGQELPHFLDFENAKSMIAYRLINYKENTRLLKEIPHIAYLDLAIVFYLLIDQTGFENTTALIRNNQLMLWNINTTELYDIAIENTPDLLPYEFTSMSKLMARLFIENFDKDELNSEEFDRLFELLQGVCSNEDQMYVLSNKQRFYGAAALLYPDMLEMIAKKLDNDFFILPSSIHEVIILPFTDKLEKEDLIEMVHEVNATEVDQIDRLSNTVYIYSRQTHDIQF